MNSPLASGTKLGRYEIRSLLGVGGMGEVYRARDDKLNRDVAIKILPATFSQDASRLRRFEQEAQATGTLNHPNILAVFDVGIENGAPYVVSELLEGRTLRECLQDGPLPQRVAVDYAIQIARGLQVAHEKAIVHRDLKPENLFITQDQRVKILDFGLAKLVERSDGNIAQTEIETRRAQTAPGTVMGTVGYMSPEQVRGDHIDHRSDIFSFGAVLYEMLTGERAFRGDTAVETLNAILKEDPPQLSSAQTNLSSGLDRLVWHCLEKNRERRFQSAIDVAFALESLSSVSSSERTETASLPESSRRQNRGHLLWIAVAAGLLLTALLVFATTYRREPSDEIRLMKFSIMPPPNSSFGHIALSPDGKWLAFAAATGAKVQLWVRPLDSVDARVLPGTDGASYPFWSPDGRFIGFFAGGKLKKTGLSDGITTTICDVLVGTGGTWNRDGVILFSSLGGGGLFTVGANGREVTSVKKTDHTHQESEYADPWFLPDGRHYLYSRFGGRAASRGIYVTSLDNDLDKRLLDNDSNAEYAGPASNTGYLLFGREETLMAQPFDLTRYQLTNEPAPVAARVGSILTSAVSSRHRNFSVSDNGTFNR